LDNWHHAKIPADQVVAHMCRESADKPMDRGNPDYSHATVMRDEVLAHLGVRDGGLYVDATLGGGGHSEAILRECSGASVIGIDRDPLAIDASSLRLAGFGERFRAIRGAFGDIAALLEMTGVGRVDGIVADLGLSSAQLDDPARGMSFRSEGPIDMRMDPDGPDTALDLIAKLSQEELADTIYRFGEERRSRGVARRLKMAFEDGILHTTIDLRRAVVRATGPARVGGVDPATRAFQALRIAVNHELDQLAALVEQASSVLLPGGIIAIISFHSLEDRIVKHAFLDRGKWERITKKPMLPSEDEKTANSRSRSAKLRAARRPADRNCEVRA